MTLKHASNITVRSLQFKFRNQSSNSKQRCSNANPCCNHDMSGDQSSPDFQPLPLSFSSGDPCPLTLARRRTLYSNVAVMQTLAAIMTCQETSRPLTFVLVRRPLSPDFSPQAHSLQQCCSNANPCCNHDMSGDQSSPDFQPLPLSFSSGDPCPLTLARRRTLYNKRHSFMQLLFFTPSATIQTTSVFRRS